MPATLLNKSVSLFAYFFLLLFCCFNLCLTILLKLPTIKGKLLLRSCFGEKRGGGEKGRKVIFTYLVTGKYAMPQLG